MAMRVSIVRDITTNLHSIEKVSQTLGIVNKITPKKVGWFVPTLFSTGWLTAWEVPSLGNSDVESNF